MMKKCLLLLMAMMLSVMSVLPALSAETERFSLIPGIYWGNAVDEVKDICGRPDYSNSISVVDTLGYYDIEFAGKDNCSLCFTFTNNQLTKMHLLIFEFESVDMLYSNLKKVFEDEYGTALRTNENEILNRTFAEDINGDLDLWYISDDTIMYVECQKETILINYKYYEKEAQSSFSSSTT